jgi:lipoate-protein ligase A
MPVLEEFKCIIDDTHLSAKDNMSIDKELFFNFKKDDKTILRLYNWEDSFTYGVSQKFEDLGFKYGKSSAKRITGGGILLHGNDISYCIITPAKTLKSVSVKKSYEILCEFIMEFYRSLGLNPAFAKDLDDIKLSKSSFCQVGFEPYDIIIDGRKIGGNAQKRSRDKILQHGSIPYKKLEHPKGGYSLEDFGIRLGEKEVMDGLIDSFRRIYVGEKTSVA